MDVKDLKKIRTYQQIHEGDIYCTLKSSFEPCIGIVNYVSNNYFSYISPHGIIGVRGDDIKKVLLLRLKGKGKLEILVGENVAEELEKRNFAVEAKEVLDKARVYLAYVNKKRKKPRFK